ncbi:hypothetical protein R6Q59_010288, partial [Mikania micrantha]
MGGGNGQKSKMAREKILEKGKAAAKGSQLKGNKNAISIQVKIFGICSGFIIFEKVVSLGLIHPIKPHQ